MKYDVVSGQMNILLESKTDLRRELKVIDCTETDRLKGTSCDVVFRMGSMNVCLDWLQSHNGRGAEASG